MPTIFLPNYELKFLARSATKYATCHYLIWLTQDLEIYHKINKILPDPDYREFKKLELF